MSRAAASTLRKKPRQARAVATVEAILEATSRVLVQDHKRQTTSTQVIPDGQAGLAAANHDRLHVFPVHLGFSDAPFP